jgi:steroid delta-isomerase-like uncharacterized protein
MSTEHNKATVHRIFDEFLNTGNPDAADELFAADFVNHSPGRGASPDREGMKKFITSLRTTFPDLKLVPDDLIAEGDRVAIRMTISGTHQGEIAGVAPTGKRITWAALSVLRFADGKAVERWNISDELDLLRQLGVRPSKK